MALSLWLPAEGFGVGSLPGSCLGRDHISAGFWHGGGVGPPLRLLMPMAVQVSTHSRAQQPGASEMGGTVLIFLQFSMGISSSGSPVNGALISDRVMTNPATEHRHPSAYGLGVSRKVTQLYCTQQNHHTPLLDCKAYFGGFWKRGCRAGEGSVSQVSEITPNVSSRVSPV